jgi:hypothetical protein
MKVDHVKKAGMIEKCVLLGTCAVVALMALFPPFHYQFSEGRVEELGYAFIGSPPVVDPVGVDIFGTVNLPLLFIQILGVLIVGAAGYFFALPKDTEIRMRALP